MNDDDICKVLRQEMALDEKIKQVWRIMLVVIFCSESVDVRRSSANATSTLAR
jgi:hypothetical protein